jgi:putative SOS response-associated peptidase YedK
MCGRYRFSRKNGFPEYFEVSPFEDLGPRYNIAPTQPVEVVRQDGNTRVLSKMLCGLIPSWAKESPISFTTLLDPTDGFNEWKRSGKTSR